MTRGGDGAATGDTRPPAAGRAFRHALALFLLAGFCLSSLDATAKYLVADHALFLVVWARYAGQMLFVTPFAWRHAGPGFWRTRRLGLQLLRSTLLLCATACFFAALRYLPLAEGSAITFLAPIFGVLLSGPLLGERPNLARWIATGAGFCGILVLVRPGSAVFHPAALLLVLAALFNALYYLLTRKLVDESMYTTLFYSALVGTVGLSLALPWELHATTPTSRDGLFLVLGPVRGSRPLADRSRLPARAAVAAVAVFLPADDLGDAVRLSDLRSAARSLVRGGHERDRRQRSAAGAAGTLAHQKVTLARRPAIPR